MYQTHRSGKREIGKRLNVLPALLSDLSDALIDCGKYFRHSHGPARCRALNSATLRWTATHQALATLLQTLP
jgi:hypothetical protein